MRYAADSWCTEDDTEDGLPMVVSAEFVGLQVKKIVQRREQWLRDNSLPLHTIMNEDQEDAFLAEAEAEYLVLHIRSDGRKLIKPQGRACCLERRKGGMANVSDGEAPRRCFTC